MLSSTNNYRNRLKNKSASDIVLDRRLVEAVGFPIPVNGVSPSPDIDRIKELLIAGATLDHYVPARNDDSHTWDLANAFMLATISEYKKSYFHEIS